LKRKPLPPKPAKAPPGAETNHVTAVQVGGSGKRSPRLRVIPPVSIPPDWEMKPGVPKNRGECENGPRPCPYVECDQHLWVVSQSDRPGNPKAGKQGATTLRPASAQTCTLDVARQARQVEEIAKYMGLHHSRVRQIAEGAILKIFAFKPQLAIQLMEAWGNPRLAQALRMTMHEIKEAPL
jgi:hypothetical protein